MTSINTHQRDCQSEQIGAYLDGELNEAPRLLFEAHLSECSDCSAELLEQRSLLCALDSVLSRGADLPLPKNFTRIVAARAESDMSGVRERGEHGRALRLCLLLGAATFALLGMATSSFIFSFARRFARPVSTIADLAGTTVYDAVTGLSVISRLLSREFVPGSSLVGILDFLLLAFAVFLLSRLIANYHRTRLLE
jgi:predicted anti-sigma-YlaC factor YlaD